MQKICFVAHFPLKFIFYLGKRCLSLQPLREKGRLLKVGLRFEFTDNELFNFF